MCIRDRPCTSRSISSTEYASGSGAAGAFVTGVSSTGAGDISSAAGVSSGAGAASAAVVSVSGISCSSRVPWRSSRPIRGTLGSSGSSSSVPRLSCSIWVMFSSFFCSS